MFQKIIEKNINKLEVNDVDKFAREENIILNKLELDIIFYYIKNEWKTLIYGDSNNIFRDLKTKLSNDNYNKITKLFAFYKEKYKNYL